MAGSPPGAAAVTTPTIPAAPPAGPHSRELREYQVEAADAVVDGWMRGVEGPAVVLPTGSESAPASGDRAQDILAMIRNRQK